MHIYLAVFSVNTELKAYININTAVVHWLCDIDFAFLSYSFRLPCFAVLKSVEASRLQPVLKDKERAQEVNQRAVDLNESFSKVTEKKLQEKMDAMEENKKAKIQSLLDRLSLHVRIVFYL